MGYRPQRDGLGHRRFQGPCFGGLLWPPLTVGKKMAAASTCLDTPTLPSEAPADARLRRGPRACIFHTPGGLFQPGFTSQLSSACLWPPRGPAHDRDRLAVIE